MVVSEVAGGPGPGEWRIKENRPRTVSAAILLCLHLGVDPPDLQRTNPTSHIQAFCDTKNPSSASAGSPTESTPLSMIPLDEEEKKKAAELCIIKNIQNQFEHWQPRCRYKVLMDPTIDECKRLLISLRKASRDERILFHYNGHGVPRPTAAGELWMFNRQFTQYIPISIQEIFSILSQSPLSASNICPSLIILDCPDAAMALGHFIKAAANTDLNHLIILASSSFNEPLPQCPVLPQDLFTSALTNPIKVAQMHHKYKNDSTFHIKSLDGSLMDRRSPLGFLNWQFTAITDSIAWSILPPLTFRKLFREDVLVASMMRNFLFASRIMNSFSCRTISHPPIPLPSILKHPLWDHWDLIMDDTFSSLEGGDFLAAGAGGDFFIGQMDLMELAMESDDLSSLKRINLPIILQILLSQSHRLRALELLAKYLDFPNLGHEDAVLQVGIHPYLLKLFQSTSKEIRKPFLKIWLTLLRWDRSTSEEIVQMPQIELNYFQTIIMEEGLEEDIILLSLQCHTLILTYNPTQLDGLSMCSKEQFLNRLKNLLTPFLFQSIILYLSTLIESLRRMNINCIQSLYSPLLLIINGSDIHYKEEGSKVAMISLFGHWLDYLTLLGESLDKGQRIIMPILINFLITDPSFIIRLTSLLIINSYLGGEKNLLLPKQLLLTSFEFGRRSSFHDNKSSNYDLKAIKGDFVRGSGLASLLWKALMISSMDPDRQVSSISKRILESLRHRRFLTISNINYSLNNSTPPIKEFSLNSIRNPNIFIDGIRSFALSTLDYIYLLGDDFLSIMGGGGAGGGGDDYFYEFEPSLHYSMIFGPPLILANLLSGSILIFDTSSSSSPFLISNSFRMPFSLKKIIYFLNHLFIIDSCNYYIIYSIEYKSFIKKKMMLSIEPLLSFTLLDGLIISDGNNIIRFDHHLMEYRKILPSIRHEEIFFNNEKYILRDGNNIIFMVEGDDDPLVIETKFDIIASDLSSSLNILLVKSDCSMLLLLIVDDSFKNIIKTLKVKTSMPPKNVKISPNYDLNRIALLIDNELRIFDLY